MYTIPPKSESQKKDQRPLVTPPRKRHFPNSHANSPKLCRNIPSRQDILFSRKSRDDNDDENPNPKPKSALNRVPMQPPNALLLSLSLNVYCKPFPIPQDNHLIDIPSLKLPSGQASSDGLGKVGQHGF